MSPSGVSERRLRIQWLSFPLRKVASFLGTSLFVTPVSSPPFRCGDTSSPAISLRVHFVARCFVMGTLGRQPFRHGDTLSLAVSSRGQFVKGQRGRGTKTSICKYKCIKIININLINECMCRYKCIKIVNISLIIIKGGLTWKNQKYFLA